MQYKITCKRAFISILFHGIRNMSILYTCKREKIEEIMLIDFSVANFRSFGEEQSLSMIAGGKFKDHEHHCVSMPRTEKQILKTSVIYGANAAGKSNLVKAIDFVRDLVVFDVDPAKRIAVNQFRFTDTADQVASFDIRFLAEGRIYQYGFDLNISGIVAEWLVATNDSNREVEIFNRVGQEISLGNLKSFSDDGSTSASALIALKQLGARPNQLLLNKVVDLAPEKRGSLLHSACWWFTACLTVIEPSSHFGSLLTLLDSNKEFSEFAKQFLETIGTGIDALNVEQVEIDTDQMPKEIVEGLQQVGDSEAVFSLGPGSDMRLDTSDSKKMVRRNLMSGHRIGAKDYTLSFSDESDGTQRFMNLLPALFYLSNTCHVFVIDELDRSLHPLLSYQLLKFFTEACPGSGQQMIVTTHETHLLDQDLLRRDEIWFVEKDDSQQSKLTSLANMNVRKDMRIEKGYLHGRFGGVPFIGNTDRLMEFLRCEVGES